MIELPTGDARRVAVTVLAFVAAWFVARSSSRIGSWIVNRQERRLQRDDSTNVITGVKRRETALSLVQTTIRYIAYLAATLVLLSQLSGGTFTTVAGASVLILLIGFAGQRFLTDILTGVSILFVVCRAVGDVVSIHAANVQAARRIPRGSREREIEVYLSGHAAGRGRFEDLVPLVPVGP